MPHPIKWSDKGHSYQASSFTTSPIRDFREGLTEAVDEMESCIPPHIRLMGVVLKTLLDCGTFQNKVGDHGIREQEQEA